jgi:exosortase/archaeosortase family protein
VTFAGPIGRASVGRSFSVRRIGRAGIFASVGVLAALNAQADQILQSLSWNTLAHSIMELGGVSAIIWFAIFATLKVGLEDNDGNLSRRDAAVAVAVVALSFIPLSFAAKGGLVLAGFYLFLTSVKNSTSRRVSLVLLALTGPLVWGRALLAIFATPILALDARIVSSAIGSSVQGNLITLAGHHGKVLIGEPCSSVHNISIAIVLWTTAAVLFRLRPDRQFVGIGIAMVALMFALNIARLAAIGLYPQHYEYLHYGEGAALFGWAGLIGASLLVGFGAIRAAERQQ